MVMPPLELTPATATRIEVNARGTHALGPRGYAYAHTPDAAAAFRTLRHLSVEQRSVALNLDI